LGTGPFANLDGDACADFVNPDQPGGGNPLFVTEPITFLCVDEDGDGLVDPISFCTSYDNQAGGVCSDVSDAFPSTNSKCGCSELIVGGFEVPPFDLEIVKAGPATLAPGGTGTYTIIFANRGNGDPPPSVTAYNAVFSDTLPDGMRATSVSWDTTNANDNADCQITPDTATYGNTVTCTPGNDAPNPPNGQMTETLQDDQHIYTVRIDFEVDPDIGFSEQVFTNTACIDASKEDGSNPTQDCDSVDTTTPVTLSYFQATRSGRDLHFEWSTATEVGNVGFNLYVARGPRRERLNAELIPTQAVNSLAPQDYEFLAPGVRGKRFWIESVDIRGEGELHGPFELDRPRGRRSQPTLVDWETVRGEHAALKEARKKARKAAVGRGAREGVRRERRARRGPSAQERAGQVQPLVAAPVADGAAAASAPGESQAVELMVNRSGLYRITFGDLIEAGFDLRGIPTGQLGLRRQGSPVPFRMIGSGDFGEGDAIEFFGEGLDTLYTDTAVYRLGVDPNPLWAAEDTRRPPWGGQRPAFYLETLKVEEELAYSFIAPNGDPFYAHMFLAYGGPDTESFSFPVDNYVTGDAPLPTLSVELWGLTSWPRFNPDHELVLSLNGRDLAWERFDGTAAHSVNLQLPAADHLRPGDNELTLTVTGETGADWDMIALDAFAVTYPRALIARDGRLTFEAQGDLIGVSGLPDREVVVYRRQGSALTRMTRVRVGSEDGGYRASFAGSDGPATYLVSTVDALLKPAEMAAPPPLEDINTGRARYLIVSHGNFVEHLQPLVAAREAKGLSVKVVDVAQIYEQYGAGAVDPEAIRSYIAHAITMLGTEAVLLVGGDCYDYRDYLGTGCVSLIPSLYDKTDPIADFAPVDPKYVDVDRDGVPDADIGRFPVSTRLELELMIEKTLAYESGASNRSAVFAADVGFGADSDGFLKQMSAGGLEAQKVYLDELTPAAARAKLIESLNLEAPRFLSFVGHSGTRVWTLSNLLNDGDAADLVNGTPMVVSQWGCWNTYYVDPYYDTLAHAFLLSGPQGAAAVMGSTAISYARSERLLGDLLSPKLAQGMSIGAALTAAKQELAQQHPEMKDVLYGWTILGDPTLEVVDQQ
jgi:uncharacterized repeat protein (TIGR01451 family)